jgi:mannose PTS system EIID component
MSRLRGGDLVQMALRASALQATWNYERQQGLGWAWALEPALDRLARDPEDRLHRLAEHTAYFNTQPTMASLALGVVANLEEGRVNGEGPDAEAIARIKHVLASSLAALGDRLFWTSLRPFAACLGVLFAIAGSHLGGVVLWLCYNAVHLPLRWRGVEWGYREGPAVVSGMLRQRLERLTATIGVLACAVLGVMVSFLLVPGGNPQPLGFQILLTVGLGLGFLTALRHRPTPTAWGIAIGAVSVAVAWMR